jgi:F0F1-type ATP synthase delta subunit
MTPDTYSKAMFELSKAGKSADGIVSGLVKTLKRRGALALLPKVLSSYKRLVERASTQGAQLTVARSADIDGARRASAASDDVRVMVDERIIGGYRYEEGGRLMDHSFKSALLQVYRNATKA